MGLWEYGASSVIVEDVHLIKSIVTVCFLIFCNFYRGIYSGVLSFCSGNICKG